ncbi:MAG: glutaminase A, partial [Myxococcota bacterium]
GGEPARYIPELANVDLALTAAAGVRCDGSAAQAGDTEHRFTLQSSAKLLPLIGLLEERGLEAVFAKVGSEPSGDSFSSLARIDEHGPLPSNPFDNAGAIALCSLLEGNLEDRIAWMERWAERLYGTRLDIHQRVMFSERRTGDRNRSIAYLLKSNGVLEGDVDRVLETYFALCSFEATVVEAARLPAMLAKGGVSPRSGERIVSRETAACVVALMATTGMYDESGTYLRETGLPAKSGVSGVIVAVAPRVGGIAVFGPRVNAKGGSVRGHRMLRELAGTLGWHFAL